MGISESGKIVRLLWRTIMSVILKHGKDGCGEHSSYKLTFIINIACKILANVATKILLSTLLKLICPNLKGFMKTRLSKITSVLNRLNKH